MPLTELTASALPHGSTPFWSLITRLGEAQILVPAALLSCLWMVARLGARRAALEWLGLLTLATGLTTASKLAFMGWGIGHTGLDFTGISGHAMFATAVLPVLFRVMGQGTPAPWPRGVTALGYGLALLVAASRLPVQAHTVSEVVAGATLGGSVSALVLRAWPTTRVGLGAPLWWPMPLLLLAWLTALPASAPPSRTHGWVMTLSMQLSGRSEVFTRADLHRPAAGHVSGARTTP